MNTLQEVERAVLSLSPRELAHFREWFAELEAQIWDEQFEKDVKAGKLDMLADQAIADFQAGNFKEL